MKRGSLNLSINAIVVLILAITLLGLGLGFVKSMFDSAEAKFDVTDQELKTQVISELASSGDKVTFKNKNFNTENGVPKDFYFGVRNTANSGACFQFNWTCQSSLDSDCPTDSQTGNWTWFKTFKQVYLEGGESNAYFVTILPDSPGNYKGYMAVLKSDSGNPSSLADCAGLSYKPYAKNKFYLDVR
ncbi:MAG: hypothetical protein ACQESG_01930 [Nanobdellota archaeon]